MAMLHTVHAWQGKVTECQNLHFSLITWSMSRKDGDNGKGILPMMKPEKK